MIFKSAVAYLALGIAVFHQHRYALGAGTTAQDGAEGSAEVVVLEDPLGMGSGSIGIATTAGGGSVPAPLAAARELPAAPTVDCSYSFTAEGLQAVKCGEDNVSGCYLDKKCFWTLYYGHLVKRSASIDTYQECCALVESGVTPDELLDQDVNAAIGRVNSLLRRNTKFCKKGALELTQGEYDALVFGSFNGAVFAGDFLKDKDYLLGRVTKRTKSAGGAKRVNLLNTLWYDRTLSCTPSTYGPGVNYLQAQCRTCMKRTADKEDDKLCLAAKKKQCCPPKDSSSPWTSGDCCENDFVCGDPSTLTFCGGGGDSCGCSSTVEGDAKFCGASDLCTSLTPCTSSSQCTGGYKCIPNTCCDGPVCLRPCPTATAVVEVPEPAINGSNCADTWMGCLGGT